MRQRERERERGEGERERETRVYRRREKRWNRLSSASNDGHVSLTRLLKMRIDFTAKRNKVISFIGQRAPVTRGRSHARAARRAYFYSASRRAEK